MTQVSGKRSFGMKELAYRRLNFYAKDHFPLMAESL